MGREEIDTIKGVVDAMLTFFDDMGARTNLNDKFRQCGFEGTASAALKMDVFRFLAYLSASDGVIGWNECDYIGEVTDFSITPQQLNEFIVNSNTYSEEFETEPPLSLKILVQLDNGIYESGGTLHEDSSSILMQLYATVAKGLIECNFDSVDDCDEDLKKDFMNYMNMMKHFINKELKKRHIDVIFDGNKKKDSTVKAPKKNQCKRNDKTDSDDESVKAPKKKV